MKLLAEKRPAERERVKHFNFVFLADSFQELDAMLFHIVEEEPARSKDISQRRFYVKGRRVFVRDEDDAMAMIMKFEKKFYRNPNRVLSQDAESEVVPSEG